MDGEERAQSTKKIEVGRVAGPSANHRASKDPQTPAPNIQTPTLHNYFENAKMTLRRVPEIISLPTSHRNETENPNTPQNASQELFSSWASDAPKDVIEASKKRKYDSMMNLTSSASNHIRNSPTVLAGSKMKKRKAKKQRSPRPKRAQRQPLDEVVRDTSSKYKKKLRQAPKEVKAFVSW